MGLKQQGMTLLPESFQAGMESLSFEDTISDVQVDYSADDHRGADLVVISQIQDGNWKELMRK